jgi:hypothetical protein
VAIDQAAVDLVNAQPALADCCLETNKGPGEDKFRGVYPHIDWSIQLGYAEEVGLGNLIISSPLTGEDQGGGDKANMISGANIPPPLNPLPPGEGNRRFRMGKKHFLR